MGRPGCEGRRLLQDGATTCGVDEDEYERLTPLPEKIRDAARAAKNAAPA